MININDKKYSIEECFELLNIKDNSNEHGINSKEIFDSNGNYSFPTDLAYNEPNSVVCSVPLKTTK